MSVTIRTGNTALADCKAHLDPRSHTGECIPFALDPTLPDHAWALYIDGRRVGALHPIAESVIRDIRKALEKVGDTQPAPVVAVDGKPSPDALVDVEPSPACVVEPWQMTRAEFTEQALATNQPYQDALANTPHNAPIAREHAEARATTAHAKAVLDALKDGKGVPGEALADYPGWHRLKKEPQPAPVALVEPPPLVIVPPTGGQVTFGF